MTLSINSTFAIILSVVMLNAIAVECLNYAFYAECHYAECRYAECRGAQQSGTKIITIILVTLCSTT
jgi:hypothetical protein